MPGEVMGLGSCYRVPIWKSLYPMTDVSKYFTRAIFEINELLKENMWVGKSMKYVHEWLKNKIRWLYICCKISQHLQRPFKFHDIEISPNSTLEEILRKFWELFMKNLSKIQKEIWVIFWWFWKSFKNISGKPFFLLGRVFQSLLGMLKQLIIISYNR